MIFTKILKKYLEKTIGTGLNPCLLLYSSPSILNLSPPLQRRGVINEVPPSEASLGGI
jgi:hypothetical protein